jgi:ABC-2 type transport system permease protein
LLAALLYLRFTSLKNWLLARGRRLRQPKYLLGAIVGVAYFYFFFFRPLGETQATHVPPVASEEAAYAMEMARAALPEDWLPATTALGSLALLTFITFMWVVPAQRAALGFSEAEIAFLFPAPITRTSLVHFRLLSAQLRSLVGAIVMMLFSNRWAILGGNAFTHAVGWWFVFATLNLHFSGANFTLTRLADLGLGAWRRRLAVFLLILVLGTIAYLRQPPAATLPDFTSNLDLQPATEWIIALTNTAPLSWLLWPFKCVIGPFLAVDGRDFLLALGPGLAVVILHYLWVVRTAIAFEDASVDYAEKRAARIAAWRAGQHPNLPARAKPRSGPFPLAGRGRPELAFLWKNLLSTWQYFTLRALLICAAVIVAACLWIGSDPEGRGMLPTFGIMALFFGAYALIVGPQFARQDIRSDLGHADVLKTYPLAGWQIVLGELLTPVVILTGVLWLTLLTIVLTFQPVTAGLTWMTIELRIAAGLAVATIIPPLAALQLLVPNAAALVFPGWFQLSRTRGGGPEVFGQRMIFFFAQLITMILALLPAAGMAALLIFILQWWLGSVIAVIIAAIAVLVVLIAEVWCGIWWLGERFERLDLSMELRTS